MTCDERQKKNKHKVTVRVKSTTTEITDKNVFVYFIIESNKIKFLTYIK